MMVRMIDQGPLPGWKPRKWGIASRSISLNAQLERYKE